MDMENGTFKIALFVNSPFLKQKVSLQILLDNVSLHCMNFDCSQKVIDPQKSFVIRLGITVYKIFQNHMLVMWKPMKIRAFWSETRAWRNKEINKKSKRTVINTSETKLRCSEDWIKYRRVCYDINLQPFPSPLSISEKSADVYASHDLFTYILYWNKSRGL